MTARWLTILFLLAPLHAAAQVLVPEKGEPWQVLHSPTVWVPVYWDARFDGTNDHDGTYIGDAAGKPMARALRNYLFTVCAVADVGWLRVSNPDHAFLCFHYGTQAGVWSYCRHFHPYPGGQCSSYFATDGRNYWLSTRNKNSALASANQPMWQQTFIRVCGHAVVTVGMKWFPEQSTAAALDSMRSPHMSQSVKPLVWVSTPRGPAVAAVSGNDLAEMARWRAWSRTISKACREGGWLVQTADISS
jgi:hypothetical protein